MNCFWCGEPVGQRSTEFEVGGVKKTFHQGFLVKDCLNDFLKWRQQEATKVQLLTSAVKAARHTH